MPVKSFCLGSVQHAHLIDTGHIHLARGMTYSKDLVCSSFLESKDGQLYQMLIPRRRHAKDLPQACHKLIRSQAMSSLSILSGHNLRSPIFCCRTTGQKSGGRPILSFADAARQVAAHAGLPAVSQLSHHQSRSSLMESLVQEVASPRTYTLLKEYYEQSKVSVAHCCLQDPKCSSLVLEQACTGVSQLCAYVC